VSVLEWVIVVVVIVGVIIAVLGWDRYRGVRPNAGDSGSRPTNEVFVDPVTAQPMRVWYNPSTGEREYRADGP
jgi:hypothetical protein